MDGGDVTVRIVNYMDHRPLSSIIIMDESHEQFAQLKKQSSATRVNAILQNDYNHFLSMKEYVLQNLHKLKGHMVPIEVSRITNLPNHECVILNDLLLVAYTEAEGWLRKIEDDENKQKGHINGTTDI